MKHPVGVQRRRRFTAHIHAVTRLWYVYDHVLNGPVVIGLATPGEAYAEADKRHRAFVREVRRQVRAEGVS